MHTALLLFCLVEVKR